MTSCDGLARYLHMQLLAEFNDTDLFPDNDYHIPPGMNPDSRQDKVCFHASVAPWLAGFSPFMATFAASLILGLI
eukprot:1120223-Pelagomonas_calceolata.AAC.4